MSAEHVRVEVGGESYALPVDAVLEVGELEPPTPVPGAPAGVLGVCNLRGQVLPVLDFAALMGVDRGDPPARVVVAQSGERRAALAVNGVVDVGPLPDPSEPAPADHLSAATLVDGELVGLVEVGSLLGAVGGARP